MDAWEGDAPLIKLMTELADPDEAWTLLKDRAIDTLISVAAGIAVAPTVRGKVIRGDHFRHLNQGVHWAKDPTRWNNLRHGDYGVDYFDRAAGALEGLSVHDREEAVYFSTYEDGSATLLDGPALFDERGRRL